MVWNQDDKFSYYSTHMESQTGITIAGVHLENLQGGAKACQKIFLGGGGARVQ